MSDRPIIEPDRLAELVEELCGALGKPYGVKNKAILGGYVRTVGDQPEAAVEWAVDFAIRAGGKRPDPAQLLALCLKSGKGILPPPRSAEERAPDVHRCRECLEWAGWHRLASRLGGRTVPVLIVEFRIRHASSCTAIAAERRELGLYVREWVDTLPDRGLMTFGADAHKIPGVYAVMPVPEPAKPSPSARPRPRTPSPYRPDRILPAAAVAVPGAQKLLAAGDYPTEEEALR